MSKETVTTWSQTGHQITCSQSQLDALIAKVKSGEAVDIVFNGEDGAKAQLIDTNSLMIDTEAVDFTLTVDASNVSMVSDNEFEIVIGESGSEINTDIIEFVEADDEIETLEAHAMSLTQEDRDKVAKESVAKAFEGLAKDGYSFK
ncbi:hypothetical protein [Vibrio crassostreae]|uniref:hypothetical protein n=1 Tax=Vibrio crassostreae TaxID=246167 RepID=UPI001B306F68|nr:hypothetical protein [Vibrio crassostreae]